MGKAILAAIFLISLLSAISLSGCSEKKYAPQPSPYEGIQGTDYSEKSVPLGNVDVEDMKKLEITPSSDPSCFLSPCDCNCYNVKNVPLTAKKATCAMDCQQQYGINGCVYRGDKCVALK